MADHLDGVSKPRMVQETITVPAAAGAVEYDFPEDFNVNYIQLDLNVAGQTDIPTLVELLAKLGTFDIKTKTGAGQWITGLDFNDFYYWYLAKYFQGGIPFLIGVGGGCNDLSGIRIILDAGCGLNISSKCGWTPDMEGKLKINYAADGAILDAGELNLKWVGYEGQRPSHCAEIRALTPTFTSAQEIPVNFEAGDIWQEFFAFLTTELDLATLQATTAPTLEELQTFSGKQQKDKFDVFSMIDNLTDLDDANMGQYAYLSHDRTWQGLGYLMESDPKIVAKGGTAADAARLYFKMLGRI